MYVGIDPGKTGGYAIIGSDGVPVLTSPFTDWANIAGTFKKLEGNKNVLVCLEQVHAMPGQGVSSMFSFGENYGGWQALLQILEIPYILATPQKWQKILLGSFAKGESKNKALEVARRRFPSMDLKKKDSGVTDALFLALYARYEHTRVLT